MKNISYRIYTFFIALLCFSLGSIVFFTQDNELHKAIGKEIPNIEINNFTLYLINPQYTQAISWGTRALRFEEHEEIYELFMNQLNNNFNEYIYAPFVYSKNHIYTFSQGVDYLRLDGLYFWSKWATYHYATRIFRGRGDFILHNSTTQAIGQNIYYNILQHTIKADSIRANITMEGK
ncbi:hypothetical protein [uncultured Helicobacter sp.]|uniref:hypothetical protein n=1 Tax=uncultured Helicobacter sp. TaxID=175537 RepID=UPI0025F93B1C|nr:hypothetical protein [uncultured Helicobacter sp.]